MNEEACKLLVKLRTKVLSLDVEPVTLHVYLSGILTHIEYRLFWSHRGAGYGIVGRDPVELLKEAIAIVERT